MPMYEYRCSSCGTVYEKLRKVYDADRDLECPECESHDVERLLSTFATSGGACAPAGGGGGFR